MWARVTLDELRASPYPIVSADRTRRGRGVVREYTGMLAGPYTPPLSGRSHILATAPRGRRPDIDTSACVNCPGAYHEARMAGAPARSVLSLIIIITLQNIMGSNLILPHCSILRKNWRQADFGAPQACSLNTHPPVATHRDRPAVYESPFVCVTVHVRDPGETSSSCHLASPGVDDLLNWHLVS